MASIYDAIPNWASGTTYSMYDIVMGSDNKFYYSVINNNVGAGNNPITTSNLGTKWDGYILLNGILIPDFWWKPSYNTRISAAPRIKVNQFGNGYQQRIEDGLNSNLLDFQLLFENRSEKETVSILHFLHQRNAKESFTYNLPTIYAKTSSNLNSRFICTEWNSSYTSYNNYAIEAKFQEVPI